ncbi:hypothetical protein ACWDWS_41230 [Streptomyces sp. NPDC003328]|uniref:hypothetical protein n=1 Tax=Streptomyces sp. NPDC007148 TaxID=3364775 RepID=UPI0036786DB9
MSGNLRTTYPGRSVGARARAAARGQPRRRAAGVAPLPGVVASVVLAGCAAPGTAGKPLTSPPAPAPSAVSRPGQKAEGADGPRIPATVPAETAPGGAQAARPEPTPTAPAGGPAGETAPASGKPTASPKAKLPDPSRTAPPSASPRPLTTPAEPPPEPSEAVRATPYGPRSRDGSTTLHVGSWSARVVRGGQQAVDACRDAVQWEGPELGTEDGYALRTAVIVGHDYCGFAQFARLPVGTTVTATTPRGTFTYRVYARHVAPGRGTPSHGLYWGDLTLQSCVGPDTGFSYLMRV